MLSVDEALERILAPIVPLPSERRWLGEAHGRVLAADLIARIDLPGFDNSAMDGWAVRHADLRGGASLSVGETIPAGGSATRPLGAGEAARIFTGAPIPEGADTVVMQERATTDEATGMVLLEGWGPKGEHLRRRGTDIAAGQILLAAGTTLGPTQLGGLASQGLAWVDVRRKPVVAILATGDEVHEPGEPLPPGHLHSGNSHLLRAFVEASGGEARLLGIARDDRADLRAKIEQARGAEVLLTIGGVSVGEYDFVKDVLASLGAEQDFWRVAMRPGKPNAFGSVLGARYFGLPGNPVSCAIGFLLFVHPALRAMLGDPAAKARPIPAVAIGRMPGKRGLRHFHRGVAEIGADGRLVVRLTGDQGSGISRSLVQANCLVIVPEDRDGIEDGGAVEILRFPGLLSE